MFSFSTTGRIEEIWNNFVQSDECSQILELVEVTQTRKAVYEEIEKVVSERKAFNAIADAISYYGTANERAGFEEGFRYAFQMCIELFNVGAQERKKQL